MGLSTHDVAQARAAQERGGDYVAVGSVFPTGSKPDFTLVGPDLIRKLRPQIRVPLIGIGGITAANAGDVVRAGADGVAVISAVCAAPDPARATRELLDAVQQARRAT
jgi:thiamine-phosphate diphosphorylase